MGFDCFEVEILADGTIKLSTDSVSQANHVSAEAFLRLVQSLAGGEQSRSRKKTGHVHSHVHVNHKH